VLPIALLLTYALIISIIINPPKQFEDLIPLIMLGTLLGLPALLILMTTRKIVYISWMFVYIFALPIWNLILPAYAYWHFDDFSWGNTRVVVGEKGGKKILTASDEGKFDPKSIPKKKWSDYEQELWEVNSQGSQDSGHSNRSGRSKAGSRAGSTYGSTYGSSYGSYIGGGGYRRSGY